MTAAAIVGLSAYSSPYKVWADKLGKLPTVEDNEAMRLGRDLEEYVADRFEESTGKKVRRNNYIIKNDKYPFAHANVDRLVVGEDAGLECKTTSALDLRQFKDVECPEKYYAQCVHYLAITGKQRWYLAVLVFGRGFYVYCLERDEDEINALMQAEKNFWTYVESETPPPADCKEATSETLQTIYAGTDDSEIQLFGRDALLKERENLKKEVSEAEARITEIENIIKCDLGEATKGVESNWVVTWKPRISTRYDTKKIISDHPEIDFKPYEKVTTTRTFLIKNKNVLTDFIRAVVQDETIKTEISDDMYEVQAVEVDVDTGEVKESGDVENGESES